MSSFLLREIAAKHMIHERTLKRAIDGIAIKGAVVQARATAAVEEYRQRLAGSAPPAPPPDPPSAPEPPKESDPE